MSAIEFQGRHLMIEKMRAADLATEFATPLYVYAQSQIAKNFQAYRDALARIAHRICYAVKACSTLAVLQLLAKQGAHFDIVSEGELQRVLQAGAQGPQVVFSGVSKSVAAITAALKANIACFNVESVPELLRIAKIAEQLHTPATVALRLNPDIDADTHPYITTGRAQDKFGIPIHHAMELASSYKNHPAIKIRGIACHLGSQITSLVPYQQALEQMLPLYDHLVEQGHALRWLNCGGGIGVCYQDEIPPDLNKFADLIQTAVGPRDIEIILEPGRSIVADAGVLLTTVEYIKSNDQKQFAIVDAGMNDFMRPALYQGQHRCQRIDASTNAEIQCLDIVGPICESADVLVRDLDIALSAGDIVAFRDVGAYGFSMSSNYNSRPRPAEILVDGDQAHCIRARESLNDLWRHEQLFD